MQVTMLALGEYIWRENGYLAVEMLKDEANMYICTKKKAVIFRVVVIFHLLLV